MTTEKYQLRTRQICLFIIAFLPITKLFMMPSIAAKSANEDMWISVLINLMLDFITIFLLTLTMKKSQMDFFGILESTFGKIGCKIILCFYFFMFFFKAILPIEEQRDYVEFTLYTLMPTFFYFLPFFVLAFYLCAKRLRVIGRIADVMWIITVLGFIILIILSVSNADFSALLPVGANGIGNITKGAYTTFLWFGDSAYFIFFIGNYKYRKGDLKKISLSFLIHSLMVLLFTIIFYTIFTSIAFRQRFALTEISKYTTVINNIGRFDYLGIMLILLSNLFALSLPLYFCCVLLNQIFNFRRMWISPIITVGLHLAFMVFLSQYYASIEHLLSGYGALIFFTLGNLLPLVLPLLSRKSNNTYGLVKYKENANETN